MGKYAFKELEFPDQEDKLLTSLQKGNLQSVTFEKDGTAAKMFVEANPQYKSVTLYDAHLQRISKESLSQYQTQPQEKKQKQETKEKVKTNKGLKKDKGDGAAKKAKAKHTTKSPRL